MDEERIRQRVKPFFIHDFSRIDVAGSTACASKLCPKDRKPEKTQQRGINVA
jgi:hypothetical protein